MDREYSGGRSYLVLILNEYGPNENERLQFYCLFYNQHFADIKNSRLLISFNIFFLLQRYFMTGNFVNLQGI